MLQDTLDLAPLHKVIGEYKAQPGAVIPVLQKAQEIYGWLPQEVLKTISQEMRVPPSQIYGVVTFYSQFYLTRRGRHICRQCDGTACHVKGAARIIDTRQSFLAWLQALHQRQPTGFVLSVRGHSFGFGRGLSEATATQVAPAVKRVLRLLAEGQT